MSYPRLRALAQRNERAANEMVTEIACGIHAGNEDMTAVAAATRALETAEEILNQLSDEEDDN